MSAEQGESVIRYFLTLLYTTDDIVFDDKGAYLAWTSEVGMAFGETRVETHALAQTAIQLLESDHNEIGDYTGIITELCTN